MLQILAQSTLCYTCNQDSCSLEPAGCLLARVGSQERGEPRANAILDFPAQRPSYSGMASPDNSKGSVPREGGKGKGPIVISKSFLSQMMRQWRNYWTLSSRMPCLQPRVRALPLFRRKPNVRDPPKPLHGIGPRTLRLTLMSLFWNAGVLRGLRVLKPVFRLTR